MVIVVIRGSSRFFLSLEDNIFRIIGGDRIQVSFSHSMAQESKTKSLEIVQLLQNVCAKWVLLMHYPSPPPPALIEMMVGLQALMKTFRVEDLPNKSKMLTKSLDEAQKKVECYFYVSDDGSILHCSAID